VNLLGLVRQALLIARVSKDAPTSPLTSVSAAKGVDYEMMRYIIQSDVDIQSAQRNWLFMRKPASLVLQSGEVSINAPSSLSSLRRVIPAEDSSGVQSIGCYADSVSDETRVVVVPYEMWYGQSIGRGASLRSGRPASCSIAPDGVIHFDKSADRSYQISFDYMRSPAPMQESDSSTSIIPSDNHMAIVWWALCRYYSASRDKTSEFREKCRIEMERELGRLYATELPEFTTG